MSDREVKEKGDSMSCARSINEQLELPTLNSWDTKGTYLFLQKGVDHVSGDGFPKFSR